MKQSNQLIGYISIGLAIYFLIAQLEFSFFDKLNGLHTIIGIIGICFIIFSQTKNAPIHLLIGTFLVGISIHLYGLLHINGWIDYWAIYLLLLSISFLLYYLQTKKQLVTGLTFASISLLFIISKQLPNIFQPIHFVIEFVNTFWPVALLIFGVFFIRKN